MTQLITSTKTALWRPTIGKQLQRQWICQVFQIISFSALPVSFLIPINHLADVCKKRWKNLRDNYVKQKNAEKEAKKSGSACNPNKNKWIHMDAMDSFMSNHIKHRRQANPFVQILNFLNCLCLTLDHVAIFRFLFPNQYRRPLRLC